MTTAKAFDFVDRCKLWNKLIRVGVTGKLLCIIKSLYENVKSCIKHNGFLTEFFHPKSGLLQGEVMSPILYSLYVNDFEMHLLSDNCPSVEIQLINIFLLMYADDTVLIAETPEGLQTMLNSLYSYSNDWNLTVNTDKTKIVVFRNGGRVRDNEKWFYDGNTLETVDQFIYLGMLLCYNGKFYQTQKHLAEQGRKALFALNGKLTVFDFNVETKCSVFDTYINSILSYASEIWGFHKAPDIEKLHTYFCKKVLGVKRSTCNNLVYFELGRLPLCVNRKLKIIRYWAKLKSTNNCILKSCYDDMLVNSDTWLMNVKYELEQIGLGFMFYDTMIDKTALTIIENRVKDIHQQLILSCIQNSSKGALYQHLVDNFTLQFYLRKFLDTRCQIYIAKFRLSSHNLKIESGRFHNVTRRNRICNLCQLQDIEDEFHFILKCPIYNEYRQKFVKRYYRTRPSVFKLTQLLSTNNIKELNNLGKYLYFAYNKRSSLIVV